MKKMRTISQSIFCHVMDLSYICRQYNNKVYEINLWKDFNDRFNWFDNGM